MSDSIYDRRASPSLMKRLPARFQSHCLEPRKIRELVEAVDAGYATPASLEYDGAATRLRITVNKPGGGSIRRGFKLPDEETVQWVRNYLENARRRWQEARREHRRHKRAPELTPNNIPAECPP